MDRDTFHESSLLKALSDLAKDEASAGGNLLECLTTLTVNIFNTFIQIFRQLDKQTTKLLFFFYFFPVERHPSFETIR